MQNKAAIEKAEEDVFVGIHVPVKLHTEVKVAVAHQRMTLKGFVLDAIREKLASLGSLTLKDVT